MTARACALLALGLALAGCGDDLTEIVVAVDTDYDVPSEIDRISVTVVGPDGESHEAAASLAGTGAPSLPVTLSLVHETGRLGPVTVTAHGHRGDAEVVSRIARTQWIEGRRLLLRIVLLRRCEGVPCGEGLTCGESLCASVDIPASSLPEWRGSVPALDAGTPADASGDACGSGIELCNRMDDDCDGRVDEGIDTTVDPRHCGACGNDCSEQPGVATASCAASECVVDTCDANFGDCNTDGSDGCESALMTDADHCGDCETPCSREHATPSCAGGRCSLECAPGFASCDLEVSTGCEADLTAITTCGRCGHRCTVACNAGYCDDEVVVQVAAGSSHSCALRRSGAAVCWGSNVNGRLGDGTMINRNVPTAVLGVTDATQLALGDAFSCAVRSGGGVLCWGRNNRGQIGDGTTLDRSTPVAVAMLGGVATRIAVGAAHACAVTEAGTVRCWGDNARGQLGDGTTTMRTRPVSVMGITEAEDVAAGAEHTCVRLRSGAVQCWGRNHRGQLGNGTTTDSNVPVDVGGSLDDAAQVAAGASGSHTCARRADGTVVCWGDNASGQLGDGTTVMQTSPVGVMGVDSATDIAAGASHACAVRGADLVFCWGAGASGQLGNGATVDSPTPVMAMGPGLVVQLAAGNQHTCTRRMDAAVHCWGSNLVGQLGTGSDMDSRTPVPVRTLPF